MKIRKMTREDIEEHIDCEARIWETLRGHLPDEYIDHNLNWIRRQRARDAWERAIDDPDWILLVAEEGDSIVGMARGRVDWSRLSSLGFLGVDESHRRRGIARSLVERFTEESENLGAAKIMLDTAPTLKPAVKLYADIGFVPEEFLRRHRLGADMITYSKFLE